MKQQKIIEVQQKIVFVLAIFLGLLQLSWVIVQPLTSYLQQAIHLSLMLAILFLTKPAGKKFRSQFSSLDYWSRFLLAGLALGIGIYQCCFWQQMLLRAEQPLVWDIFWGSVLLFLILEGIRRSAGNIMCCISGFFLLYAFIKVNAVTGFEDFGGCLS